METQKTMKTRLFPLLLIATLATACGSPDTDEAPTTEEGCAPLENSSPVVAVENVSVAAPVPAGGAIADGTYVLVRASMYTGVGGPSGRTSETKKMTVRIAGSRIDRVSEGNVHSATFTTRGATLELRTTCPTPLDSQESFTATPTQFSIFVQRGAIGMLVLDFAKR